jgi:hypothetical protein
MLARQRRMQTNQFMPISQFSDKANSLRENKNSFVRVSWCVRISTTLACTLSSGLALLLNGLAPWRSPTASTAPHSLDGVSFCLRISCAVVYAASTTCLCCLRCLRCLRACPLLLNSLSFCPYLQSDRALHNADLNPQYLLSSTNLTSEEHAGRSSAFEHIIDLRLAVSNVSSTIR